MMTYAYLLVLSSVTTSGSILVAECRKARVCGSSLAETAGSNTADSINVYLL